MFNITLNSEAITAFIVIKRVFNFQLIWHFIGAMSFKVMSKAKVNNG